jgi:hypothetical protein
MRGPRHALPSTCVLLLAASCASGTRPPPAGPQEPDVTLVFAGAAAQSPLVAERLEVPLEKIDRGPEGKPNDPMDGIKARRPCPRAAAARGARYVSDLEFHHAVNDADEPQGGQADFDCVVQMKTLPAGDTPPKAPPDALTEHLSRDEEVRLVRPSNAPVCVQLSTIVQTDPNNRSGLDNGQRTVTAQQCTQKSSPVVLLPYWAYDAWFLPVFYDREHPPVSAKWQLYVSEAHCTPVEQALEHSFVRGTIYLAPATTRSGAPAAPADEAKGD